MRFADALAGVATEAVFGDAELYSVVIDSRKAGSGSVFVCMPGLHRDSHDFAQSALTHGAAAIIVTRRDLFDELKKAEVTVALVADASDACWRMCKNIYGDPTSRVCLIGVTGTNGKTTTAWIAKSILESCGCRAAYLGTLGALYGSMTFDMSHTTPFAPEANEAVLKLLQHGATHIVMEVSSHALEQKRIHGFEFDVCVFTNLTHEHLDFHGDVESYFEAKAKLFAGVGLGPRPKGVINVDDAFGVRLAERRGGSIRYGATGAEFRLLDQTVAATHLSFGFSGEGKVYEAEAPLGARFNVTNCLAAISAVVATGIPVESALAGLKKVTPAPGRFETVPTGADYAVIVDYAHTPDALEKLLQSVSELHPVTIRTVFGCGGDRDKTKRPEMARSAAKFSTMLYVTSDNPRTENPDAIIAEVLTGVFDTPHVVEPDRRKAIAMAIRDAAPGDIVVVAGKGHEDYQIIGTQKFPFDDRVEARRAIAERGL